MSAPSPDSRPSARAKRPHRRRHLVPWHEFVFTFAHTKMGQIKSIEFGSGSNKSSNSRDSYAGALESAKSVPLVSAHGAGAGYRRGQAVGTHLHPASEVCLDGRGGGSAASGCIHDEAKEFFHLDKLPPNHAASCCCCHCCCP